MTGPYNSKAKEIKLSIDQNTKDLLADYFRVWEIIDDSSEAKLLAYKVIHPNFKGRFTTKSEGAERLLAIARNRRKAFRDSQFEVNMDDVYKNKADEIVVPYIFKGTYQGNFLPQEAKGKSVAMHGVAYYQVMEGKLLGLRSERNEKEMFQQLGVSRPDGQTDEF